MDRAKNLPLDYVSAPPSTERPTNVRFWVMVLLGSLAFITYFDRVCISRAESSIISDVLVRDLHLLGMTFTPKEQMGLIMGAFWLAYAIFELPGGWMGDRFGARVTLTRIVLAWSLFTCLSGSAMGFLSLMSARFLFGVGEAGAFPNMARIQSRWLPVATRARASGMLWLMARWGGAFSLLLFGSMMRFVDSHGFRSMLASIPILDRYSQTAAWRLAFWLSGLIGLIWVVVFYLWFRDHPSEKKSVNKAELDIITRDAPPEVRGHGMEPGGWGKLLRDPSLWCLGVYYLAGSFGWSFFVSWMPRYFSEGLGVPFQKSEWFMTGPLFFGGLSCLLGGAISHYLVQRTGRKRLFRAIFPVMGATSAAIAIFSMQYVKSPVVATVLLCVVASAFDFGQAANWASIVDLGGKYAGSAAGFINMVGNIGQAFQPFIGAMIFTAFGWSTLFVVYAVAYLIAASMWLFIDPTRAFYERGPKTPASEVFPVAEPA